MADINMSVSIEEQEICINAMRDEKFATIYASDSIYILRNWTSYVRKVMACTLSLRILAEVRNIY